MKTFILFLLLTIVAYPQAKKSVLTEAQKDSIGQMMRDSSAYVNVKSFGAVGDGVTDDTQAFADIITAVGDNGGGTLFIPEGTYLANIDISAYSDMHILGVGQASIIKAVTADPVITINGIGHYTVNNSVRQLEIDGNTTSYGISISATAPNVVNDLTIDNVRIASVTRGIYIYSASVGEEVYGNKFSNLHISTVSEYGIYQLGGVYNSWQNILIDGISGTGNAIWTQGTNNGWVNIATDGRIHNQGQNNVFQNISIEGITGDADLGSNAFGTYGGKTTIQGLRMTSVGEKVGYGLYLHQDKHNVSNVSFSVNTPEIPIGFFTGASGTITNVVTTGDHDYIDSTYSISQLDLWNFFNCSDLFYSGVNNRINILTISDSLAYTPIILPFAHGGQIGGNLGDELIIAQEDREFATTAGNWTTFGYGGQSVASATGQLVVTQTDGTDPNGAATLLANDYVTDTLIIGRRYRLTFDLIDLTNIDSIVVRFFGTNVTEYYDADEYGTNVLDAVYQGGLAYDALSFIGVGSGAGACSFTIDNVSVKPFNITKLSSYNGFEFYNLDDSTNLMTIDKNGDVNITGNVVIDSSLQIGNGVIIDSVSIDTDSLFFWVGGNKYKAIKSNFWWLLFGLPLLRLFKKK